MTVSRRTFLRASGAGCILGGAYSVGWEARWVEWNEKPCPEVLPDTSVTRIVHLSDLHFSSPSQVSYLEGVFKRCIELVPDIVCLTGDFITRGVAVRLEPYIKLLRNLASAAPTFACLGNHDGGAWASAFNGYDTTEFIRTLLERCGITVLHNRNTVVGSNERGLNLVGVGDLWSGECDPVAAFRGVREKLSTVVLAHNPDTKSHLQELGWTLMLSGHTHGGQVSIPFLGPLWVPIEDRKYAAGMR